MNQTKICTKCNEEKPIIKFGTDNQKKDKLSSACKSCNVKKAQKYYLKNKEKIKEYKRKYTALNRDKISEKQKKYREENKESIAKSKKEWTKKNIQRRRISSLNYAHRRRNKILKGDATVEQVKHLIDTTTHCYWCKKKLTDYHIDHYVPLSKGGKHTISNLVLACPKCNLIKNAKDPIKFANENGRLL